MNVLLLQGSPRKHGNTAQLSGVVADALRAAGATVNEQWVYDAQIQGCLACKACQNTPGQFGCVLHDDMARLFDAAMDADLIILSTPIYCWFCTAPMKAFLDRFIYASCKFYGAQKYPSLVTGKRCALITTLGYPISRASLLDGGIQYLCKHSKMTYLGMLAGRDYGKGTFLTPALRDEACRFAETILDGGVV